MGDPAGDGPTARERRLMARVYDLETRAARDGRLLADVLELFTTVLPPAAVRELAGRVRARVNETDSEGRADG